jgi:leucyl aminopeptidase (aminopeptidase T)
MNAGSVGKDKSGTLTLENRLAALQLIQDVVLTNECEALEFFQAQTAANAEAASECRKSQNTVDRAEIHTIAGQPAAKRARAEVAEEEAAAKDNRWKQRVRDSACMHVRANGQQHLYCGCTVSAGGFANISISSVRVRWTVVNDNRESRFTKL